MANIVIFLICMGAAIFVVVVLDLAQRSDDE